MRIVVFGGTGFIGRRLVSALLDKGHRVRVAARHPAGHLDPAAPNAGWLEAVRSDILDADEVERAVRDRELAINLVGAVTLPSRKAYHDLHERGARNVAVAVHAGAARLVHVSALGIAPDAPSAADRSKAAGEREVRAALPKAILVRPSLVYGEHDHFVSQIDRMSRVSPVIPLLGAETRVQPVHVDDLVEGLIGLAGNPDKDGKIIQAAGPRVYALRKVVELFLETRRRTRLIVPVPHAAASALGRLAEYLPRAPVNREMARLMRTDKIAEPGLPGLEELGVEPRSLERWLIDG